MKGFAILVLLAFVTAISISARAQSNEFAGEVSGAFPSANNLSFDTAVGYQINYAHRLVGIPGISLYVEVPFLAGFNNTRTLESLVNGQNYNSLYFTPGIKIKFVPGFFLSPYIAGGIGLAHFHSSSTSASESDFAGDIGGGLDVKVFPHISLRGEIRDFITSTPGLNLGALEALTGITGTMNNVIASGGVVLRF